MQIYRISTRIAGDVWDDAPQYIKIFDSLLSRLSFEYDDDDEIKQIVAKAFKKVFGQKWQGFENLEDMDTQGILHEGLHIAIDPNFFTNGRSKSLIEQEYNEQAIRYFQYMGTPEDQKDILYGPLKFPEGDDEKRVRSESEEFINNVVADIKLIKNERLKPVAERLIKRLKNVLRFEDDELISRLETAIEFFYNEAERTCSDHIPDDLERKIKNWFRTSTLYLNRAGYDI